MITEDNLAPDNRLGARDRDERRQAKEAEA